MSEKSTSALAANIRTFREERGLSQQQLAESIRVQRPTLSTWENAHAEPSSSQLIALAKALNVSLDALAGQARETRRVVVVDTSVLMKRPMIIDELVEKFDDIVIPHIVGSELNSLKDGHGRGKQRAWLALSHLEKMLDAGQVKYQPSPKKDGIADEKILAVAIERARSSLGDRVYMFSDDVYFAFLVKEANLANLEALTFPLYADKFPPDLNGDHLKSQNFYSLVKAHKLEELKKLSLADVDINRRDAESGFTPLIQAVRNRNYRMVEYLLALPGLDLDRTDQAKYCFTPLLHAAQFKHEAFKIFKLLVEKGADYEMGSLGKNKGNTPLMVCAWGGFRPGLEYLLEQDICVNQQDTNGFTALIKACLRDHLELALLLVQRPDVDVAIRSHENKQAVDYIKRLNDPLAKQLIEALREKRKKDRSL